MWAGFACPQPKPNKSKSFRSVPQCTVTALLKTLTPTVERIWDDFSPMSLAKIYHYQLQVLTREGKNKGICNGTRINYLPLWTLEQHVWYQPTTACLRCTACHLILHAGNSKSPSQALLTIWSQKTSSHLFLPLTSVAASPHSCPRKPMNYTLSGTRLKICLRLLKLEYQNLCLYLYLSYPPVSAGKKEHKPPMSLYCPRL